MSKIRQFGITEDYSLWKLRRLTHQNCILYLECYPARAKKVIEQFIVSFTFRCSSAVRPNPLGRDAILLSFFPINVWEGVNYALGRIKLWEYSRGFYIWTRMKIDSQMTFVTSRDLNRYASLILICISDISVKCCKKFCKGLI